MLLSVSFNLVQPSSFVVVNVSASCFITSIVSIICFRRDLESSHTIEGSVVNKKHLIISKQPVFKMSYHGISYCFDSILLTIFGVIMFYIKICFCSVDENLFLASFNFLP